MPEGLEAVGVEALGVVKADAYGHGAVEVSRVLVAEGARWLAVSSVDEAVALRCAGIATRILWVIAGLMPGVSFVTALLMWWNRSLSKKRRRSRGQPAVDLPTVTAVHR